MDLGCNNGQYAKLAIHAGAKQVIGIDFDSGALDIATSDARRNALPAQYLYQDLANPSPNQGWQHRERTALEHRLGLLDGVFSFALVHHLVIGRNIPLEELLCWICRLAPNGLIEFIPKNRSHGKGPAGPSGRYLFWI